MVDEDKNRGMVAFHDLGEDMLNEVALNWSWELSAPVAIRMRRCGLSRLDVRFRWPADSLFETQEVLSACCWEESGVICSTQMVPSGEVVRY